MPLLTPLNMGEKEKVIMIAKGEADFEYGDRIYSALFEYFSSNNEMPYGIQKARDGEPDVWIYDRIYNMPEEDLFQMVDQL